ncbi:MAG: SpaH/EbpB family LPXTG-anchored major pilin [Oscillospiraceae bacterium]|nr:SpaH/EbpB family LPXTG-anchored major pilin [Oscillospiraceae bacterium]
MKILKRSIAMLLTLVILLSAVPPFAVVGAEDEADDLEAYVYLRTTVGDGFNIPNRQYFSPYMTNYTYEGGPTYIQCNIYSMYNTLTGRVIPTYCTDIDVGALPDHRYRRLNLEDSTYAATAAGLLRAMMYEGFYLPAIDGETMEEHKIRVDEELDRMRAAVGIPDLTVGEAISGTQTAIWKAAHGASLEFTDFVRNIYTTPAASSTKYYDICHEERINGHIKYTSGTTLDPECEADLENRIETVYNYLLSLKPMAPTAQTVSPLSFKELREPVWEQKEDGTFDVTVTATVYVEMLEGDNLTLTAAVDGDNQTSAALHNGNQTLSLTIENVPETGAFEDVTLSIDGLQTVDGVFLFDAFGDRDTAQTMIAIDYSQVPVRARVLATTDRVIHFYKTTIVEAGTDNFVRYPLEGIVFDLFPVAELDDYLHGKVILPEAKDYDYSKLTKDYVLTTDADGRASINLTHQGLPDGVYLVVERPHPAIQYPVDPFYVIMPTTNAQGTGYEYEITIQPKNDLKGGVDIEKDVISLGNKEAAVDAYAPHTWIVGTTVPHDISAGKSFVITDTLDSRLDYVGNVKLTLETADGETVLTTLAEGTDYTVQVTDVDSLSEGKPSDSFRIGLTQGGMSKIAATIGTGVYDDYRLRLYFDAQINGNASPGEEIPNRANLQYLNSVNFTFEVESDEPVVYTGGLRVHKIDSEDATVVLPGAEFELYRNATESEVAAGEDLIRLPGIVPPLVKVSFFHNEALTGEQVTVATSGADGTAFLYGLAYGEYYLLETKAPDGYNASFEAVQVTIDATSHLEDHALVVENVKGTVLPSTGGIGTEIFVVTGSALILFSVVLLVALKRKKDEAEG